MKRAFIDSIRMLTAVLLLIASFSSCKKDESQNNPKGLTWKKIGLGGLTVNRLELIGNNLYAMTSDGLYVKNIQTNGGFNLAGLKGKNLLDIAVFSQTHIIASFRNKNDAGNVALYETVDGGTNWTVKQNNFGSAGFPEPITDLHWDKQNNILYATGLGVLAKSPDKGATWTPLWGQWGVLATGMMMEQNPKFPNEIWFGGQGSIENGYLVHAVNEAVVKDWSSLVQNPTVPKAIGFDTKTPQNIYVGWEGELIKTPDNGNTWQTLMDRHEDAHFFFGIGISKNNPDQIFTAKWIKGAPTQPLTLYSSSDGGNTWKENTFENENKGGVFDLVIVSENNRERIFLGLDGGGVYEVIVNL